MIPAQAAGYRARVFKLVNEFRRSHGVAAVHDSYDVNQLAKRHSRAMADKNLLFHSYDLGSKLRTKDARMWGENIGAMWSVRSTVRAWINSSSHRKIMLTRGFRRAGVGVVVARGHFWITMIFYG